MKIPVPFLVVAITAIVLLQSWTLSAIVDLKQDVAALKVSVTINHNLTQK